MDKIESALRAFANAVAFDATHGGEGDDGEDMASGDVSKAVQGLMAAIDARIDEKVAEALQRSR